MRISDWSQTCALPIYERHGDRRRLDVGGVVHLDGGPDRLRRLRLLGLPDGLDRRLRAVGDAAGAVPAAVRPLPRARVARKSDVWGNSGFVRVAYVGRRFLKNKYRLLLKRIH